MFLKRKRATQIQQITETVNRSIQKTILWLACITSTPQHVIITLSIQKSCSNSLCAHTQSLSSDAHMQEELHSRESPNLHMVGQLPPQYLASRRLGYGVDEEHLANLLVRGHPLCDVVHDLCLRDLATRLPHHKRHRYLPCLLMRIPDVNRIDSVKP